MPKRGEPNGEPLTVRGALEAIQRLEGLEVGIHRRTEGITWMLWGLVTAGIYFTFGTIHGNLEHSAPAWVGFLWAPWVAAGTIATTAIWRSAHLAARVPIAPRRELREILIHGAIYVGLFSVGFWLYAAMGRDWALKEPGYVLLILGLASTAVAHLTRATADARRMLTVVGTLCVLAALALAFVPYASEEQAFMVQSFVSIGVAGGGWFLGGLRLTVKG